MSGRPNFFLIGAPKCGTTSLSEYLRGHPDVLFSTPKEPDHFNTDYPNAERGSDADYLARCFAGARSQKAVGEGSTHYLSSHVAVSNILAFSPGAKFIVMLRDPVQMAQSLYFEERSQLVETAATFEEAWDRQWRQERPALHYGRICKTGAQLARLYDAVPDRSRIMVIDFARFATNTADVYGDVLDFLGLAPDNREAFHAANSRRRPRSRMLERFLHGTDDPQLKARSARFKASLGIRHWPMLGAMRDGLRRINLMPAVRESLAPGFEAALRNYFADDMRLVKSLTGIELHAAP